MREIEFVDFETLFYDKRINRCPKLMNVVDERGKGDVSTHLNVLCQDTSFIQRVHLRVSIRIRMQGDVL